MKIDIHRLCLQKAVRHYRLLILDDEQPTWITFGEIPSLVDETTSQHSMRIQTCLPSRKEIIWTINAFKRSKVGGHFR